MKPIVTINVTAARRGEPCIRISAADQVDSAVAFETGRDLQLAADWAEELAAKADTGQALKAVE